MPPIPAQGATVDNTTRMDALTLIHTTFREASINKFQTKWPNGQGPIFVTLFPDSQKKGKKADSVCKKIDPTLLMTAKDPSAYVLQQFGLH